MAIKLENATNVWACVFKPKRLEINTQKSNTSHLMFLDFTGNYSCWKRGEGEALEHGPMLSTCRNEGVTLLEVNNVSFLALWVVALHIFYGAGG